MPIDFHDHVPTLQASIVCRTAGLDVLNDCAVDPPQIVRLLPVRLLPVALQLVANIGSQVGEPQTPAALPMIAASDFRAFIAAEHFEGYGDANRLIVASVTGLPSSSVMTSPVRSPAFAPGAPG